MALALNARRTDYTQAFITMIVAEVQLAYALSRFRDRWPQYNNQWKIDAPTIILDDRVPGSEQHHALPAVHAIGFPHATQETKTDNPFEIPERQRDYTAITLGDPTPELAQKLNETPLIDLVEQYIDAKMLFRRERTAIIWIPLALIDLHELTARYEAVGWTKVEFYTAIDSIGSITLTA